ncbi:hypothetical protein PybrP1_000648 [[Pythium] brassicae (nom. inval.)]|nr:hypothetical protein PybrP1_000648 [[Pythium] brassicae (nom. inval.)]
MASLPTEHLPLLAAGTKSTPSLPTKRLRSVSAEVAPLVTQNASARREVEDWIAAQKQSLRHEKAADEHLRLDRARQTHDAQRKREALQQQEEALAASVHKKESEVSAHQVEIEVLQSEKIKKEPILRELFLKNQEEDQKLKLLVHESKETQSAQERQLAELQQGLAMYQRLANQIIVRFTQIDPAAPNRVFSFRIRIDPVTDRFQVDECNEPVASFDGLVEDLNDSGDLAFFIRAMRRQFKALV